MIDKVRHTRVFAERHCSGDFDKKRKKDSFEFTLGWKWDSSSGAWI